MQQICNTEITFVNSLTKKTLTPVRSAPFCACTLTFTVVITCYTMLSATYTHPLMVWGSTPHSTHEKL